MTNMMQDGVAFLGTRLTDSAGVEVTYTRGSGSVTVTAVPALHRYEVIDAEGFGITALSRDYLIHAADLVISGSTIAPRAGDRVTETIGGTSTTFEVMAIGAMKEYEPLDTDGLILRVHTKKIA